MRGLSAAAGAGDNAENAMSAASKHEIKKIRIEYPEKMLKRVKNNSQQKIKKT